MYELFFHLDLPLENIGCLKFLFLRWIQCRFFIYYVYFLVSFFTCLDRVPWNRLSFSEVKSFIFLERVKNLRTKETLKYTLDNDQCFRGVCYYYCYYFWELLLICNFLKYSCMEVMYKTTPPSKFKYIGHVTTLVFIVVPTSLRCLDRMF